MVVDFGKYFNKKINEIKVSWLFEWIDSQLAYFGIS